MLLVFREARRLSDSIEEGIFAKCDDPIVFIIVRAANVGDHIV